MVATVRIVEEQVTRNALLVSCDLDECIIAISLIDSN